MSYKICGNPNHKLPLYTGVRYKDNSTKVGTKATEYAGKNKRPHFGLSQAVERPIPGRRLRKTNKVFVNDPSFGRQPRHVENHFSHTYVARSQGHWRRRYVVRVLYRKARAKSRNKNGSLITLLLRTGWQASSLLITGHWGHVDHVGINSLLGELINARRQSYCTALKHSYLCQQLQWRKSRKLRLSNRSPKAEKETWAIGI